ncbi:NUDIX hydrolase [Parachryseolinea silvisoli]|uniref:NUDIX hydrolase n=1 Tax=Parachryseolinea silvisoli TaxID=2873601 RepID=UPI002265C3ED|nr:NUDIX hydrolase [Parachryseolinea silvisoli]MCD9018651.1 NUDIX hydrolase [Parachryseolinea silvisoli]
MDIQNYKHHKKILVAVDCIIFGFDGSELKALLIKRGFEPERGKWSLMGGFVGENENADKAALRVLHQLTGMKDVYVEQLHTFTDINRDTAGRVISIAYFALINIAGYNRQLEQEHESHWFPLNKMPALIFDHKKMVEKAKGMLRQKVATHPVGFELLAKKFTLPQLQNLYEAIYETELDKRNFAKKMLSLGILKKLDEKERESSKKGAFYYVFDAVKYRKLESNVLKFI